MDRSIENPGNFLEPNILGTQVMMDACRRFGIERFHQVGTDEVYGEGINIRDWLYVKDHCYGILAVLEKGRVGEVYNFGGHNEKANIEIVKIILRELGKPESLIAYVADHKGHGRRYAIDPSKENRELNREPTTMFADSIKLTIRWYKDHMDWMQECSNCDRIEHDSYRFFH